MTKIANFGYPPVGRCIYCGTTKTTKRRLTKEHIIARALGGTVTLADASCALPHGLKSSKIKTCSEVTRDIEQFCFRNMLGHIRHRMGLPIKQKMDKLPLTIIHPDRRMEVKDMAIEDHLGMFALPVYEAPRILTGTPAKSTIPPPWCYVSNPDVVRNLPEGSRAGVVQFNERPWARMLAKIAHSCAVAQEGLDAFRPLLPDFILGKSELDSNYFVGCFQSNLPPVENLHELRLGKAVLGDGREFLTAKIRLFGNLGAPQYHVVVGSLNKSNLG